MFFTQVQATNRELEAELTAVRDKLAEAEIRRVDELMDATNIVEELQALLLQRETRISELEEEMSAKVKAAETRLMPALNAALARIKELESTQQQVCQCALSLFTRRKNDRANHKL